MNQRKNYLLLSLCLTITFLVKGQNCSTLADVRLAAEVEFLACVTPFGQGDFEDAAELICEQASDGSWLNNADYCNTSDDDWKDHLKNLVELCEIYADGSTFSVMLNCGGNNITITQNDLEDAILDGLTFWYQFHNNAIANNLCPGSDPGECECANTYPCTDNWFDNWIGKQEYLQKIGILFLDVLSQAQYQGLLNNIINDLPDNIQDCNSNRSFTGANLTDVASSMITRGLLACDAVLVREGVVAMQSALDFAPYPQKEGIQQDFSIHQHGPLLYNGGYGISLLEVTALWGAIVSGSSFEFNGSTNQRLFDFVLEGTRRMTIGNTTDYSANGRNIARRYPGNNAAIPVKVMDMLIGMADQNSEEFNNLSAMRDNIQNGNPQYESGVLEGNTHFWKSDYVTHHESNYFSSVKMCSTRTLGTETENNENILGYWLPYGCTFYYSDGDEYINCINNDCEDSDDFNNIFPYWDWAYIPGVTSPDIELMPGDNDVNDEANTQFVSFVGNANNQKFGVTAMDYFKDFGSGTVSAKKAWFHFGTEVIALGDDISGNNLHTTINQPLYAGTHTPGSGGSTQWVEHDGITYVLPNNQTWELDDEFRVGGWNLIDGDCSSNCAASGTVFKIFIDHVSGNNADSYYYIVAPGQPGSNYDDNNNPITVLEENNNNILAVSKTGTGNDDLAGMVYFPEGSFPSPFINVGDVNNQSNNPLQLRVNRPCALLYDESNLEVCISSPDRRESEIILTVQTANNSQADMTFTLPVGEEAGTSICMKLSDFRFEQSCNSETPEIILTAYLDLPGMIHTWSIEENGVPITGLNLGSAATTPPVTISNFDPTATYTAIHTITINGATITSEQEIQLYEIMQGFPISANHYISTSNGYDPVLVISGDMVISNNAYVVISSEMTVRFCGADSKLIIEPGSTLDLRGKLSDLNGQTWDGVRVLGNLPQIFNPIKGKFIGRQTATIENAQTAIYNGAKYKLSHGGHINCKGMLFLNNRQSIVCEQYNYPNNAAIAADCDFEVNDAYPHQLKFRNFIYLGFVEGFQVKGSRFNNNMAILDADMDIDYGVGIRTWGSSLTVDQYSDQWKVVPSEFNRLGYGISAHFSFHPKDKSTFTVQHSKFNHCFVGIRNMGITGTNVLYSTFDMGALPPHEITDPVQSGICYEGTIEGFDCEENYFLNNYSGPNDIAVVGIFCDDTGESDKEIRNNIFDRMTVGNLANDVNGTDDQFDIRGLTYLCNNNTGIRNEDIVIENLDIHGESDIEVTAEDGTPNASFIRSLQATTQNGVDVDAGNLFSDRYEDIEDGDPNETGFRNANGNPLISYWYYDDGDNDAMTHNIPGVDGDVEPEQVLNENTCQSALFIPPCCEEGVKDGFKSDYYQNKSAYDALKPGFNINPTPSGAIELSRYRAKMDRAAYKVVLHELNDTTGFNQDSLYNWIRNINTIGANLWLSRLYLADGEDTKALNVLDNIPTNFTLSTQQGYDLQRYRQMTLLLAGENPDSLSESTLQSLEPYEEAGGQTEIWAKNILMFHGAHYSPEYAFGSFSAQPNENLEEESQIKSDKNMLSVSPNPAKEFVNFRIRQMEKGTNGGVLEILDINGRLLERYSPVSSDQTIKWQTEDIPGGIYFYRWSVNGEHMQSGKVIVNK